jgi:hypothetical protein
MQGRRTNRGAGLLVAVALVIAACRGDTPTTPTQAPVSTGTPPSVAPSAMTGIEITNLTPNPSVAGILSRVSASGTGGTPPYQFKYIVRGDSGAALTVRDWSADPVFSIQITSAGSFPYEAWGRSAGFTEDAPQASTKFTLTATAPPPGGTITGISLSVDAGSPRPVGQAVTFTAHPIGGIRPYQVKWRVNGQVTQDWTPSLSWAWVPATPGVYELDVWARSAGATADAPEATQRGAPFTIVAATGPWMTNIRFGELTRTRQGAAAIATLRFSGEGGTPPYQFQVKVRTDTGPYQLLRDWDSATEVTWTIMTIGSQQEFLVAGRSAGSVSSTPEIQRAYIFSIPP